MFLKFFSNIQRKENYLILLTEVQQQKLVAKGLHVYYVNMCIHMCSNVPLISFPHMTSNTNF